MSIRHIDDLPSIDFVKVLERLPSSITSIKMDGANLWFGVDQQGVFVTREGKNKSSGRVYSPGDFEDIAANDQFKAALSALQAVQTPLNEVLTENDIVEIEVIFGSQPNVVKYHNTDSEASIIFLRTVSSNSNRDLIYKLGQVLKDRTVSTPCEVHKSADGIKLEKEVIDVQFNFTSSKKYSTSSIIELSNLEPEITELKTVMAEDSEIAGVSNADLEVAKTTDDNKHQKINAKIKLHKLKVAVKNKIYNLLSQKIDDKSDKEGFVIDFGNSEIYKIVDRNHFTKINDFFQKYRKTAISTILTTDSNADSMKRGGIVGEIKIRLSSYLGKPEFARSQVANGSLKKLGTDNFLKQFKINDLQTAKNKMLAIVNDGIKLLNVHNTRFMKNKGGELPLSDTNISYTDAVINRTKTANAEAFRELIKIKDAITSAKNVEDLTSAVFGRFIDLNTKISEGKEMISFMLLEDEAAAEPQTSTASTETQDAGTSAKNVASTDARVGSGRYKFVMRARNDSVLVAMKKKKLNVTGAKNV